MKNLKRDYKGVRRQRHWQRTICKRKRREQVGKKEGNREKRGKSGKKREIGKKAGNLERRK